MHDPINFCGGKAMALIMDTLLQDGEFYINERGYPETIEGLELLMQKMMIRLTVQKGSFVLNPSLGSRMSQLDFSDIQKAAMQAKSFAEEALADLGIVSVDRTVVSRLESGHYQINLFLSIKTPSGVTRKEVRLNI